jgi:uncharacterized Fe-S center protein
MATVYWIKGRSESVRKNLISKIDALMRLDELSKLMVPETSLAIKFNLSEVGYGHYLPPLIFSIFLKRPAAWGLNPP